MPQKNGLDKELKNLKHWEVQNEKLYRKLIFKNFINAFSFMTHIAIYAEKADHHPEWKNIYNQIEIWLIRYGFSFDEIEWIKEHIETQVISCCSLGNFLGTRRSQVKT